MDRNMSERYGFGGGGERPLMSRRRSSMAPIDQSVGWCPLPEVKLASWDPENKRQWKSKGKSIATRNLIVSSANLFCGLGVWQVWSAIANKIRLVHDEDPTLYTFQDWGSPQGKDYNILLFTLPAVAGLTGGTTRIANSFMTEISGGRNVVFHASIILTAAMIWTTVVLTTQSPSFTSLLIGAWLSGAGGGSFASSMSNMSTLYPKSQQGYSLGINGCFGNLGVGISQLFVPIFMDLSFGKDGNVFPEHAGWFWWPLCVVSAIAAFFWMSNHPDHGHQHPESSDKIWNILHYYWLEGVSLLISAISAVILVTTRDAPFFASSLGKISYSIMLVVSACLLQHLALWFCSPPSTNESIREQWKMFHDKHTYIMTILYIMSFGTFIGFSSAFPKLISDIFGFITVSGCFYSEEEGEEGYFVKGGTEFDCTANLGEWGEETIPNPNAPYAFSYSWLGPVIGSLIRPVGGILADHHGGGKVTHIMIVWCTFATFILGVLVQFTVGSEQPEKNFGLFVFLFLNIFFSIGTMNGTTFRTIGVLFDERLAGPVLGWSSAIAAYSAYVIPAMFTVAIDAGTPEITLYGLGVYYIICGILNHIYYDSSHSEHRGV